MNTRDTRIAHHRQPRAFTPLPDHHHKPLKYCAIMEYEPQVKKPKSPKHVVQDLGTVLPGVEKWLEVWRFNSPQSRPHQFLLFCSPDPETVLLRGTKKTLRQAVLFASGSCRLRTDFKCRPVEGHERAAAVAKFTGWERSYIGADWVLERDRKFISRYEREYEKLAAAHRSTESRRSRLDASRGDTAKQDQGTKQSREDNHVGTEQKPTEERTLKRKRTVEEPEVTKSPLVDAGEVEGPSKRMRAVDPITKADRKRWVEYFIRMSRGTEKTQESLLRDFVFEHGNDRNWTYNQWAVYLNNNKADLHHQIDRARRDASKF